MSDSPITQLEDSRIHENTGSVQIVRFEGEGVKAVLFLAVGFGVMGMVTIGLCIWAVFTAQNARDAINLARTQYVSDTQKYADQAAQETFWRQRMESTLAAEGLMAKPAPNLRGSR